MQFKQAGYHKKQYLRLISQSKVNIQFTREEYHGKSKIITRDRTNMEYWLKPVVNLANAGYFLEDFHMEDKGWVGRLPLSTICYMLPGTRTKGTLTYGCFKKCKIVHWDQWTRVKVLDIEPMTLDPRLRP